LGNHIHRVGKRPCQEVLRATHGKAWFVLPGQNSSTGRPTSLRTGYSPGSLSGSSFLHP
jgi:hypothetical protein